MGNDPKLDIWGEPEYSPHECFRCGEIYNLGESSAPVDYRTTYCSLECYNKDHLVMEQQAIERSDSTHPNSDLRDPQVVEDDGYTTSKIGDFILKVKKKEGE